MHCWQIPRGAPGVQGLLTCPRVLPTPGVLPLPYLPALPLIPEAQTHSLKYCPTSSPFCPKPKRSQHTDAKGHPKCSVNILFKVSHPLFLKKEKHF